MGFSAIQFHDDDAVEMVLRQPHGHEDLEIGILLEGSVYLFLETNVKV